MLWSDMHIVNGTLTDTVTGFSVCTKVLDSSVAGPVKDQHKFHLHGDSEIWILYAAS